MKSGLYKGTLNKKAKKINEQFGDKFMEESKKDSKSGKKLDLTGK